MTTLVYLYEKKKKKATISIINVTFGSNFGDEIDERRLQKAFATSYT